MDIERSQDTTPKAKESKREWVTPDICEYDVDLVTQSNFTPSGADNGMYS